MNRKIFSAFMIIFILIFAQFCVFADENRNNLYSDNKAFQYFLIESDKKIKIYNTNNLKTPCYIFELDVETLSDFNRYELQKGLLIKDKSELNKIIEDYTS